MRLNSHLIFESLAITSSDITDFVVYTFSLSKNKAGISYIGRTDNRLYYSGKIKKVHIKKEEGIILTVNINKKEFKYDIDLNKAAILVFTKLSMVGLILFKGAEVLFMTNFY